MPTPSKPAAAASDAFVKLANDWSKGLSSLTQASAAPTKTMEAFLGSWTAALKASQNVSDFVLTNGRKSFDEQVSAALAVTRARSAQEALELQTANARKALSSYTENVTALSDLIAEGVQESLRPLSVQLRETFRLPA